MDKLAEPQTRLHGKLRERRVEALEQLKNQSEDVKKIETEIFSSGQRLGAVLKENHRYDNKPTLGANNWGRGENNCIPSFTFNTKYLPPSPCLAILPSWSSLVSFVKN